MAGPGHILLVDDDEDLRNALALGLRSKGHLVVEAENGEIALSALASSTAFRLVVLDLMMPVMDGPSFLVRKAKGEHAALPVVIFSSSPCIGLEGLAGVVSVVSKTQGIEALVAAIAQADRATLSHAPARAIRV
jgi:CheY-like chemotaxis protein